eukprot:8293396-Heterocapsa_arctica.AAC.1
MSPSLGSFMFDGGPQFRDLFRLLNDVIHETIVHKLVEYLSFSAVLFSFSDENVVFLMYAKFLLLGPKLSSSSRTVTSVLRAEMVLFTY